MKLDAIPSYCQINQKSDNFREKNNSHGVVLESEFFEDVAL